MTTHDDAIRKALGSTPRPEPAGPFAAAMAFAWRGMLKVKHVPEQLLDVTITPVMLLLMFTYIFGGAIAGTVIIVLGVILGFDPEAGVGGVVAALALVVVFAFGLSWVFTTLGLVMRSPNAVMNAGFMAIFPLTFLSNVFVEPDTLPAALEWFVNVNPISILADASRGLMAGDAQASDVLISLGVAAGLTAVFLPLTTRLYRSH